MYTENGCKCAHKQRELEQCTHLKAGRTVIANQSRYLSKGIFHNVRVVLTCAFQDDERDASYEIIIKKNNNNNNTVCSSNIKLITKKNKKIRSQSQ